MNKGYFGKVLWINLSQGEEEFKDVKISDETYRQYIGGYGLGCKILFDHMDPQIDPFSESSLLGFFPGLLTGTVAPLSGRYMVVGKSPLTGSWGDANSGGTFGPEIKKCGYDGIIIEGKADNPKYVSVIGEKKEILDASEIWGLDIFEAEKILQKKHGKFIKTAGIGQAGEKLSRISGIVNDHGRIAARSGIGAVMGSKNLKALILKGSEKISINDKKKLIDLTKEYNKEVSQEEPGFLSKLILKIAPNLGKILRISGMNMAGSGGLVRKIYHNLGTVLANTLSAEIGDSPVKNWGGIGQYDFPMEKSKAISANEIRKYKLKEYGCYSCPIQCGGILKIPELDLEETHQPEYETCAAFGTLLLNNDLMSLFKINEMCNRAGIDTISTGTTVAFAIECFENGLLTLEENEGLELTWGNSEAIVGQVEKIIKREGIGDLLADGVKIAAQKIGKGSEKYAMESMGQEIAMHNPRMINSLAFSYAYDPTPGRHTTAGIDYMQMAKVDNDNYIEGFSFPKGWKKDDKKKAKAQKLTTELHQIISCAGLCQFTSFFGKYPLVELINAYTGWDTDLEDLLESGYRIQTLRQAFALREGIEFISNELPGRVTGHPPDEKGPMKGVSVEYKQFYLDYCKEMGWNTENGYPLKDTLKKLDLEFVIKDLY
jgi:aldehyde:ferredoxin oxidoreductase